MKLNSIDSEEGDENVRKEINHRVEQDARDAYESLRSQGKLVAATFATQSLGLSLVLSRFAPTHQLKRKELTPQKTLRRTLSNGDLNDEDDEGRRLVIVEDTFSDRGGGVARALLRPMDELVGVSTSPFADEAPPVEDVDLVVDLTPSAFDALLVKIRDAPRPLTLVFARGRCLAAVRRRPRPALSSKTAPRPDAAPRPRCDAAAPAVAPKEAARAAAAVLAPLLRRRVQLFADGERGFGARGPRVPRRADAPPAPAAKMTPTNRRAPPRGHRRINREPPTRPFAAEEQNLV